MSKNKSTFICQACGQHHTKWQGKCDGCGEWNTLVEEVVASSATRRSVGPGLNFGTLDAVAPPVERLTTGIGELDRVLGGGIVPGSVVLIGGDPGIGKSTLQLQMAAVLADRGAKVSYVSGEESLDQVRLRARRLGREKSPVQLAASNDAGEIAHSMAQMPPNSVLIVDSIQTVALSSLDSAAGTVSQVRACATELSRIAKERGIALFLIGHVTKEGTLAGPKVLEHLVDCTLYFVGDQTHQYRIVRAVKNRFGATDEIGVFSMTDRGLVEVANPSELFLSDRLHDITGSAVFPGIEGTRPILIEVQALVAPAGHGTPRRTVVGWDNQRLAMLLAVLEARGGLAFSGVDVFLNVVGGFKITEPAADLAMAAALISALTTRPLPPDLVCYGELGLGGEVRPVGQAESRLKEAAKLGFAKALGPHIKNDTGKAPPLAYSGLNRVVDLVMALGKEA